MISVPRLFTIPHLHTAAGQSASALQFTRPCNLPCWPSHILSLIILKSKTDGSFIWIPQCIAVVPLTVSGVGTTSAMLNTVCLLSGWDQAGLGAAPGVGPWGRHCPTTTL